MNRTLSFIMMMMMICVEHENYRCTYLYLARYLRLVLLNCRATNFLVMWKYLILKPHPIGVFDTM